MADRPELAELLAAESAWLHDLARGLLHDRDRAADLAQEASVAALRRRPDVGGSRHRLRGWLAAAAQRLALAAERKRRLRGRHERGAASRAASRAASEHGGSDRLALHRRLLAAIDRLPEPYRTTVVLRYLEGLLPREIAKRRGVAAVNVRQHLSRALRMLRQELREDFGSDRDWRAALLTATAPALATTSVVTTLAGSLLVNAKKITLVAILLTCAVGAGVLWNDDAPVPLDVAASRVITGDEAATPVASTAEELQREAAAPPSRDRALVRVVDERGARVGHGRVFLWRDGEDHSEQALQSDGTARFEVGVGAGGVFVRSNGYAPALRELDDVSGKHEIVLDHGLEFSGALHVESRTPDPEAAVNLILSCASPSAPRLPASLRTRLGADLEQVERVKPGDSFRFRGLAKHWRGTLSGPKGYLLKSFYDLPVDDRGRIAVDHTHGHGRLVLVELPAIRGIVRWRDAAPPGDAPPGDAPPDDATAVAGANLMVSMQVSLGMRAPGTSVQTDAEGRFCLPIYPENAEARLRLLEVATQPQPLAATLRLSVDEPRLRKTIMLDEVALRQRVVPIWLDRPVESTLHVLVQDAAGKPIAGARFAGARFDGVSFAGATPSTSTDEQGRGTVQLVATNDTEFVVGARGFELQRVRPPSAAPQTAPWTVRLERGAELHVRVTSPGGVTAGMRVVVRYREPIFAGGSGHRPSRLHESLAELERPSVPGGRFKGEHWRAYLLPTTGVVDLISLVPGKAFTVELLDRFDGLAAERSVNGLAAGHVTELPIELASAGTELRIAVKGPGGEPVPKAHIMVWTLLRGFALTTGNDGRATFGPLFGEIGELALEVNAPGFATARIARLECPDIEVSLRSAVAFVVHVRDPHGSAVHARSVTARPLDDSSAEAERGTPQPDGRHAFAKLPPGAVEITCTLDNHEVVQRAATGAGHHNLGVPAVGGLDVRWARPDAKTRHGRVTLTPVERGTEASRPLRRSGDALLGQLRAVLPGRYRATLSHGKQVVDAGEVVIVAKRVAELRFPR